MGLYRIANCDLFNTIAVAINYLRKLENAETGGYIERLGVYKEVNRIMYRQLPWQRGFVELYRYSYVYINDECFKYFESKYDISIDLFSLVAFYFYTTLKRFPHVSRKFDAAELGVNTAVVEAALKLLALPLDDTRKEACRFRDETNKKYGNAHPSAYRPSPLRHFPIISFGHQSERLRAPLPQLIFLRLSAGIYYDLVDGPARLRNIVAERFERYSLNYINSMLPKFSAMPCKKYIAKGEKIDTPDILIKFNDKIVIAVECKAKKLTFAAQFSNDPVEDGKAATMNWPKEFFNFGDTSHMPDAE